MKTSQPVCIYSHPEHYASFPSITRTEGRIIVSFPLQDLDVLRENSGIHPHEQKFSRHQCAFSDDEGQNWTLADQRPDHGRVLHASRGALTREGEVARANKDNTDAGPFSECPFSPFSYERTSDGALLAAVYARDPEITDPQYSIHYTSFFLRSEDEGNSWQYFSRLPSPSRFNYEEPTILAGPDGLVVCMIRVGWGHTPKEELPPEAENPHGRGGGTGTAMGWFFYQSLSYDHGLTWTEPEQTEIWGHPAYLLRLRSGTVLMVYGHRRPPWSVRSILSFDEGRTWDLETMMTIREFNPGGRDLGYPLATQLDDGSVLCAYYGYISENVEKVSPQGIYVSILKEG